LSNFPLDFSMDISEVFRKKKKKEKKKKVVLGNNNF
jgi:hypothetical protein